MALAFLCAACGTTVVLNPAERALMRRPETVLDVERTPPPEFSFVTPGKALMGGGGALGAVISQGMFKSEGERMRVELGLVDPAAVVVDELTEHLRASQPIANVRTRSDSSAVADARTHLLRVETEEWRVLYYATDWSHYRVRYQAHAQLTREDVDKVIWEASCDFLGDEPEGSRTTRFELELNEGELLKKRLQTAAQACATELIAHLSH